MKAGELCTRTVVFAREGQSVYHASRLMRRFDVGDVVVVEEDDGIRRPIGLITDRDIAVNLVAQGLDPRVIDVDEIMMRDIITIDENHSLEDVVATMKRHAVRRLPVVNDVGGLEGILSLDDIVDLLAEELGAVATLIKRQQERQKEALTSPGAESDRIR